MYEDMLYLDQMKSLEIRQVVKIVKNSFFSGFVFIGFGMYFLLQQYNFTLISELYTWPSLLIIVGIGLLLQGYAGKEYDFILPGVVLSGIGIHFHITTKLAIWPNHTGIFLLIIALGLLLTYVKTGKRLFQGVLFLVSAIFLLFFDRLIDWAVKQGLNVSLFSNTWPFLFIVIGAYFMFFRKK